MNRSIGLDVGHSAVKVVGLAGGLVKRITFPSLVMRAVEIHDDQERSHAQLDTVSVNGVSYFTGRTARIQGGAEVIAGVTDDWVTSPQYEALVQSSLDRMARAGLSIGEGDILVVGLPSGIYNTQKEIVRSICAKHTSAIVRVIRQPQGAYYSVMLNEHGEEAEGRFMEDESWAVVDVGYHTTDFLLMIDGHMAMRADKHTSGMRQASQSLMAILSAEGFNVDIQECDEVLSSGKLVNYGQVVDVVPFVFKALQPLIDAIADNANRYLGADARRLRGVIVAGGGAVHVGAALRKQWPHTIVSADPRMSIAEGFARFGLGYVIAKSAFSPATTAPLAATA